jgi:exodeoxyribonuclease V alpha subunit
MPTEKLRGELVDFTQRSPDFWGTGFVRSSREGSPVKISGKALGASVGDTVELDGYFETSKWGRQFKFSALHVVLPKDTTGVVEWLAAKLPNISTTRARAIVERFGVDGTWGALDAGDVDALVAIDGITPDRAQEIIRAYKDNREDRDRIVRFKQWGLTDNQIGRVLEEWGTDAEAKIRENPYQLMACVHGFGWKRADAVALRMGLPRTSIARCTAGILHFLGEAAQAGHCFVSTAKLVAVVARKTVVVDETYVRAALDKMVSADDGHWTKLHLRGGNVYVPRLDMAEEDVARAILARMEE